MNIPDSPSIDVTAVQGYTCPLAFGPGKTHLSGKTANKENWPINDYWWALSTPATP